MRLQSILGFFIVVAFAYASAVPAEGLFLRSGSSGDLLTTPKILKDRQTTSGTCPAKSSKCGSTPGPCNKNGCAGINGINNSQGVCTAGDYIGCSCSSVCGKDGPCNKNGCNGINDPNTGKAYCTAGDYNGCTCTPTCSNKNGPCNKNGCVGLSFAPGTSYGWCTSGDYAGCKCNSACSSTPGSCTANGCQGSNGICTAGNYLGCTCK